MNLYLGSQLCSLLLSTLILVLVRSEKKNCAIFHAPENTEGGRVNKMRSKLSGKAGSTTPAIRSTTLSSALT